MPVKDILKGFNQGVHAGKKITEEDLNTALDYYKKL